MKGKSGNRETKMRSEANLSKGSIPVSSQRMERLGTRSNEDLLVKHSKAQFLPTVAPPVLDQKETLLNEDWSPSTTYHDSQRVTGGFSRTDQGSLPHSPSRTGDFSKTGHHAKHSKEHLPAPSRSYVYPVMVATSPKARGAQVPPGKSIPPGVSIFQDVAPVKIWDSPKSMTRNESAPATLNFPASSQSSLSVPRQGARDANSNGHLALPIGSFGNARYGSMVADAGNDSDQSSDAEQDARELGIISKPVKSNFFNTPRASGKLSQNRLEGQYERRSKGGSKTSSGSGLPVDP